jgi:hypothetical protein
MVIRCFINSGGCYGFKTRWENDLVGRPVSRCCSRIGLESLRKSMKTCKIATGSTEALAEHIQRASHACLWCSNPVNLLCVKMGEVLCKEDKKCPVFWDVRPCSVVDVNFYQNTRRHISSYSRCNLHSQLRETSNLRLWNRFCVEFY